MNRDLYIENKEKVSKTFSLYVDDRHPSILPTNFSFFYIRLLRKTYIKFSQKLVPHSFISHSLVPLW